MRKTIRDYLQTESASGVVLLAAAALAMIWANSPWSHIYQSFTDKWLFLINEGLMAIFFLVIGLELKRGFIEDQFSSASDVLLPLAAAVGGMVVPAVIYSFFNHDNPETIRGWATPVATDIAFAVGVLALLGPKIPNKLKLFLLSLAIYDDLGAIIIIAFFYSHGIDVPSLIYSGLVIAVLLFFNAFNIRFLIIYLFGGFLLWILFLRAGIHPTIAGVVTAFLIPELPYKGVTPIHYLEEKLHPWVAFLIMPIFAIANAGVRLADMKLSVLFDPIYLGIVMGLFAGKQLGVMGFTWFSIRNTRWGKMPYGANWLDIYGISLLCGIGFTMSLFLGTLSFQGQPHYLDEVRLGVITGSILSGIAGYAVLKLSIKKKMLLSSKG